MTNDTTPTENGAADVAMLAAIQNDSTTASTSDTSTDAAPSGDAEPSEPKAPSFDDMGLHPDVRQAIDDMGYFAPTPVQTAVFKPVSEGKDLLVQSRTGTGKTTAFGLPIVNRLVPAHRQPQALILAPTRELALQVARELTQIGKHRGILVEAVYGGAPIGKQIKALKDGVHIIVGTPGRVLDHIGRRTLDCRTIQTFVLDECDEMLSMGFLEDIERVTQHLPEKHQTLLFSATMPDEVTRYARRHMTAPEQISLSRDSVSVAEIHHAYYIVSGIARSRDLLKIIFAENPESAIIFCNMRDETTMVAKFLQKQGLDAEPLSSDLSQSERERVMGRMKAKNLRFLVATDVAARGIDISDLSHVINFTVPESPEVYVHRTGRTGRAGKKGTAISLVGPRELGNFRYVRLQYGIKPEERVLPKDDIFIGKLKVPLPPVGIPQPPDPVQILIRGVQGQPTDLERQIFEKLLAKNEGKRVLAALVAEKLNQLSTKTTRPRRESAEAAEERGERGERRFDREERGERRFDRDRGERRFDREERGERRPEREERGERRFDRERGERERPRFGDREERGERRPEREERGERRFDRERGERERPRFGDREERGERRFDRDRDRGERREQLPREERPAVSAEGTGEIRLPEAEVRAAEPAAVAAHEERPAREDRHGRRERRERHDREGRREHRDTELSLTEPVAAAPAAVEQAEPAPVAEVKADEARGERAKKKDKRATEVTDATREFWETWAESKATRVAEPAPAAEEPSEARGERKERGERAERGRARDRGRGRDKTSREDKSAREDKADKKSEREERGSKSKREAEATARATAADGSQARLFVSLGKKHGVSADDLRSLLAGPIGGDTAKIGSVSLRDSHAHVRVPENLVDEIIAGVHGTLHNEHNVTVERARA